MTNDEITALIERQTLRSMIDAALSQTKERPHG
jgi:hypothetical protein